MLMMGFLYPYTAKHNKMVCKKELRFDKVGVTYSEKNSGNWTIPFNHHTGGGQTFSAFIFGSKNARTPWRNLKTIQKAPGNSFFFKSMFLETSAFVSPIMFLGPGNFLITPWNFFNFH